VVGALVVWKASIAVRDLRFITHPWTPVAWLVVGTFILVAVAVMAVAAAGPVVKPTSARSAIRGVGALMAAPLALASVAWTSAAALDVRPLAGPVDGEPVHVAEPFDVVTRYSYGRSYVSSITVTGMVEAPLSGAVVDGTYRGQPVARCWTLLGTVDRVKARGWPWERSTRARGHGVYFDMFEMDAYAISVTTLGSSEPERVWNTADACGGDRLRFDIYENSWGDGPVDFAVTFALESDGMPTGLEWIESGGRTIPITLLGGDYYMHCSETVEAYAASHDQELVEMACPYVLSLDEHDRPR